MCLFYSLKTKKRIYVNVRSALSVCLSPPPPPPPRHLQPSWGVTKKIPRCKYMYVYHFRFGHSYHVYSVTVTVFQRSPNTGQLKLQILFLGDFLLVSRCFLSRSCSDLSLLLVHGPKQIVPLHGAEDSAI